MFVLCCHTGVINDDDDYAATSPFSNYQTADAAAAAGVESLPLSGTNHMTL